jgi:hypothetical protein
MRLLNKFRALFEGTKYKHRDSTLGDQVALEFFEDLVTLGKSSKLRERVATYDRVLNRKNTTTGKKARRGDGTFGELVPTAVGTLEQGFIVGRGPTANVEMGAETKIVSKAMIKQAERVVGDLQRQVSMFRKHGGNPICIAFVGVNWSPSYTSYEKDRAFPTDGKEYAHPIQEAEAAERRLINEAQPYFDEFLILRFSATNVSPYPFSWINERALALEYNALLTRVSRQYDVRF